MQSDAVRLEIYGRVARCRSEDDLEDLEEETARRFGSAAARPRASLLRGREAEARLQAARHREARRRPRGCCGDVPAWAAAQIESEVAGARRRSRLLRGGLQEPPFKRINDLLDVRTVTLRRRSSTTSSHGVAPCDYFTHAVEIFHRVAAAENRSTDPGLTSR